jgi:hypothetical protein
MGRNDVVGVQGLNMTNTYSKSHCSSNLFGSKFEFADHKILIHSDVHLPFADSGCNCHCRLLKKNKKVK